MRITFVLPFAGLSGGTRVVAIYAERLQARGHEVLVVSLPRRRRTIRDRIRRLLRDGTSLFCNDSGERSHLTGVPVPHKVLDQHRPPTDSDLPDADVVIAGWYGSAHWIADLAPSKGTKVFFVQGYVIEETLRGRIEGAWRLPLAKIAVSHWLRSVARDQFGQTDVDVVPNSVDTSAFYADRRGKQPVPTIGFLYSSAHIKGTDVALAAAEQAARDIPGLRLVAFGTGRLVRHLPLPANATYHRCPSPELLRRIYGGCDAWLFTSRCEGFGLPILEAMACRTPVIGTPAGAAPQLLSSGGGVLVPSHEPDAVAEAIRQVVGRSSDSEWRGMSEAAHDLAAGYTWDDATDLFEASLQRTLARVNGRLQVVRR